MIIISTPAVGDLYSTLTKPRRALILFCSIVGVEESPSEASEVTAATAASSPPRQRSGVRMQAVTLLPRWHLTPSAAVRSYFEHKTDRVSVATPCPGLPSSFCHPLSIQSLSRYLSAVLASKAKTLNHPFPVNTCCHSATDAVFYYFEVP